MQCLRSLVEAPGLESKTIASSAKISPSTVSLNLSGGRLPQRSTVEAIIQLCQVTDEVRAQVLRLHTAALGEAHPVFADRLLLADAYEEIVLRHDRLQASLAAVTEEHRRQRADYDDLLALHETTSQALAVAQDELRTRSQRHQEETARLTSLLRQEQDARRHQHTDFDARLQQAQAEAAEQLRAQKEEETRLRQDLREQKNKINALSEQLEDSAAEATALRHERDQLRVESARLREDLLGLQVDLAAAEAKQGPHAEKAVVAPVSQRVGHALDRHPAAREDEEAADLSPVARTETQATTGDGDPLPASVASSETDPKPVEDSAAALWVFIGAVVVSLVIIGIGMNLRTGPADHQHLTTAGWWCSGSGLFLFLASVVSLAVHEARNSPVAPGGTYDGVYSYEPMA